MHRRSIIGSWLAGIILAVSACAPDLTEPATNPATLAPAYDGFDADVKLLRDVKHFGPNARRGSTPKAMQAAQRIFRNVGFLHRSREEVLSMLGDPGTISDYGRPDTGGGSDPLVYVFEFGLGGAIYTLSFSEGRCIAVNFERGA